MRWCFTKDNICDSTLSSTLLVGKHIKETFFAVLPHAERCDSWILAFLTQTFLLICTVALPRSSSWNSGCGCAGWHSQTHPRWHPGESRDKANAYLQTLLLSVTHTPHTTFFFLRKHLCCLFPTLPNEKYRNCLSVQLWMKLLLWASTDRQSDWHSNRSYVWNPCELVLLLSHPFRSLFRFISFVFFFSPRCQYQFIPWVEHLVRCFENSPLSYDSMPPIMVVVRQLCGASYWKNASCWVSGKS